MTNPMLSINVSVWYQPGREVLHSFKLDIKRGEIVGLVGQSGSGKSTLALTILGLLSLKRGSASGSVRFKEMELLTLRERELRSLRGRQIGLVLQSPLSALNPALSIGTQMRDAWRAHGVGHGLECEFDVLAALRSVSLPNDAEFLHRRPSQISVGQAQRVLIAMAILHRPSLLIVDEPTSSLDMITQAEILALFRRLNEDHGIAILYISHDLMSVASLCDRLAILHNGEIVEDGITREVFAHPQHQYTKQLVSAISMVPRGPEAETHAPVQALASEAPRQPSFVAGNPLLGVLRRHLAEQLNH